MVDMNKKIKVLYLCIFIILLVMIGLLIFVFVKKQGTKLDDKNYETWSYTNYETYDNNGNMIEISYDMAPFTLTFRDDKVDVCYDKCYTNNYTKKDDILTINNSDYFSGAFKISYENDMMLLKEDSGEFGSTVYYFEKPLG